MYHTACMRPLCTGPELGFLLLTCSGRSTEDSGLLTSCSAVQSKRLHFVVPAWTCGAAVLLPLLLPLASPVGKTSSSSVLEPE